MKEPEFLTVSKYDIAYDNGKTILRNDISKEQNLVIIIKNNIIILIELIEFIKSEEALW